VTPDSLRDHTAACINTYAQRADWREAIPSPGYSHFPKDRVPVKGIHSGLSAIEKEINIKWIIL